MGVNDVMAHTDVVVQYGITLGPVVYTHAGFNVLPLKASVMTSIRAILEWGWGLSYTVRRSPGVVST